ncbi:type 2 lanthipeptide synthetase LanM [Enterobacter bugandensis]
MEYYVTEACRSYLYYSHLDFFNKRLKSMIEKHNFDNVDYTSILTTVAEVFDQIYLPDFVVRFDSWLRKQPLSSRDRYEDYFKDECGKWRKYITKQNEFIENLAAHICTSMLKNIDVCLTRLKTDFSEIQQSLNIQETLSLRALEILGGDRHENGQQPILLTFNKEKVIYKPRDSGVESLLNSICQIAGILPVCPQTLSKITHLWQAYIANRPLECPTNATKVYHRYGEILAIADLLNINDCHFDNFIVDQHQVYLIDAETSFQYYLDDNPEFERSIYQSGLLQSPDVDMNGIGHTSALTAISSVFSSFAYPHAINDRSEDIQVCYEGTYRKITKNYPHFDGKPVQGKTFSINVISGYENGYYRLISCADKILSLIEYHRYTRPRYLIRTTAYYTLVLNKIIHPDTSQDFDSKFSPLINQYLNYDGAHPRFKELIPYESACLAGYDIPIFFINCQSTSLYTHNNEEIKNFLPHTPLEQLKTNFSRPAEYFSRQRELITRSMHVHFERS